MEILTSLLRGWKQLANRWKFLPAFLLSAVLLTNFAQITLALHHDANERQAWDAAAAYIDAEWQDGDAFVMQSVLSLLPLERYWGDDERLARRIEPENALDNNLAIRAVRLVMTSDLPGESSRKTPSTTILPSGLCVCGQCIPTQKSTCTSRMQTRTLTHSSLHRIRPWDAG